MIGASKILTVSYGTFSCTLEGFDEPFNTMKAIAEYFRDLAAEDRYFGAEPPTPDAAMLHRIAEREIQRRVEAKVQENGVVLRAEEAAPAPLQISVPAAATPAPPAPTLAPLPPAPALHDSGGESVAARLAKLRAAQAAAEVYAEDQDDGAALPDLSLLAARTETMPASSYVIDEEEAALEDLIANELPQEEPSPVANHEATIAEPAVVAEPAPVAPSVLADEQPALPDFAEVADVLAEDQPAPFAADSVLQPTDLLPEDAPQSDAEAEYDDSVVLMDTIAAALRSDDSISAEPVAQDPETDEFASAELDDRSDPFPEVHRAADIEDADFDDEPSVAFAATRDVAPDSTRAPDFAAEFAEEDDYEPSAERIAEATVASEIQTPALPEDSPAAEKLLRARARVIKIRRSEPVTDAAEAQTASATTLLSPEAEAALQAELAALEAEVSPEPHLDTPRPVRPVRPSDARIDRAARRAAAREAAAAEAQIDVKKRLEADAAPEDVDRLIAQTNSVMDGADNKRRHSAIAHLKAAVAATEADKQVQAANPGKPAPNRADPYRLDLQNVVRPGQSDRGSEDRPPLLVLVSEQRIDRKSPIIGEAGDVAPSRPRRPATAPILSAVPSDVDSFDDDNDVDEAAPQDQGAAQVVAAQSFGDFAEKLGATNLHEQMEAAAVYCAQMLGCPQFSRTLVMQQLESLPGEAPDREDALRAFGTLLREGRITKIRRNQYAVTDRSPLLAEALRIAG